MFDKAPAIVLVSAENSLEACGIIDKIITGRGGVTWQRNPKKDFVGGFAFNVWPNFPISEIKGHNNVLAVQEGN